MAPSDEESRSIHEIYFFDGLVENRDHLRDNLEGVEVLG